MSDPSKYNRGYDFKLTDKGPELNNELDNASTAIDEIVAALADVRRSDGALTNGIVTLDSCAPGLADALVGGAVSSAASSAETAASAAAAAASSANTASNEASDAAASATAAEAAALTADVHKDTFTALDAATDIISGQIVSVADGFNGARENGLTVPAGTYTADGSLVRDLTGSGLQWVSYRREFGSLAEMLADPRTFTAGTTLTIPSIGASYSSVAASGDLTNAGGTNISAAKQNGSLYAGSLSDVPADSKKYLYGPDFVYDQASKVLYNFPADDNQHVIGREYLSSLHARVVTSAASYRLSVWGDSRPANQGTTGEYKWENALKWAARLRGYYRGVFQNNAIGGSTLEQWYSTYCDTYLTGTNDPHCIVICAGINDLDNAASTPDEVVGYLDSLLNKIRNTKGYSFSSLSIVVVIPVSAYNPTRSRDPRFIEPLRDGFKRVCRKYQACCVDGYAVAADASNGRGISYLTDLTAPDVIHQNNVGAIQILNAVADAVFPDMSIFARNGVFQDSGTVSPFAASVLPSGYPSGVSMFRATPGGGGSNWPLDGFVATYNYTDDIQVQFNYAISSSDQSMYMRKGNAGSWGAWVAIYSGGKTDVTPATGFALPGGIENMNVSANGSIVVGDGYLTVSTPGAVASGTTICTVPSGFRPQRPAWGVQVAAYAGGTTWEYSHAKLNTDGTVVLQEGITVSASRIYLGPSVWKLS